MLISREITPRARPVEPGGGVGGGQRWGLPVSTLFCCFAAAGFGALLFSVTGIPGADDGYRHVRYASRLIHDPLGTIAQPWSLAYFWPKPADIWFGYHALLSPFTLVTDAITAAKLFNCLIFTAMAGTLLALLRQLKAAWIPVWGLVALAGSGIVLYRAAFCRPYLFSEFLVLLALLFTLRQRAGLLMIVSAIHACSYSIFFLAALPPGVWLLLRRDREAFRLAAACALGMAGGLLVNPYFPENVRLSMLMATGPLTVGIRENLKIAGEVQPLTVWWLVSALPVLAAWIAAAVVMLRGWRTKAISAEIRALFFLSAVTFAGSIRVSRTFDLFVPFAALFAAGVLTPWVLRSSRDAAFLAALLAIGCGVNLYIAAQGVMATPSPNVWKGAAEYLLRQPPGSVVLNTHWEQYPFLYFWNPRSVYLTGVDPTFFYVQDRRRYWLWRHIADDELESCGEPRCSPSGKVPAEMVIRRDFRVSYVVVEHSKNPRLEEALSTAKTFRRVYRDDVAAIFAPAEEAPPPN